jgi:RNA polymerase sigma-70 factor (ECF subfamily)
MVGEAALERIQAAKTASPLESVELLVAQHSLMVFRIAYYILRNHHDAEDAVQECYLRVLKYGKKLDHVRNSKTWLARIIWTVALDRRSHQKALAVNGDLSAPEMLDQLPDPAVAVDEQMAGEQMQRMLARLIAGLPDDLRHPLELSTVQELNSAEIAEMLGIPEGSVRTRLMRARKLLKEKLSFLQEGGHERNG